jgi:predicted aspartyl protease
MRDLSVLALAILLGATEARGNDDFATQAETSTSSVSPVPAASSAPGPLFASPTTLDRIGRIVAPVTINGLGPFRFIVDTGANSSVLTTRLMQTLGLTPSPDQVITLRGVTGAVVVPAVVVDSFQTGDLTQRALRLPVVDNVMGAADGILGMRGFDGKRITVDFVRDRIEIADSPGTRAPRQFITLPARLHFERLLLVDARVGGVRTKAIIDTGAERTLGNVVLRDTLLRKRGIDPASATQVIGLNLVEEAAHAIRTPTIVMGDANIANIHVVYGDIDVFKLWQLEDQPAMLVGMDVLGTLRTLMVDYERREVMMLTQRRFATPSSRIDTTR